MQSDAEGHGTERGREADRALLVEGAELRRPLQRAAKLARVNGASYLAFGALSVLLALPSDFSGLAIGAVLFAVGWSERRQAARLSAGELDAPRRLAWGELALMLAILGYSVAHMTFLRTTGAQLEEEFGSGVVDPGLVEAADSLSRTMYGVFIAVTLVYQGSLALRFHRLTPRLERYLARVPAWARTILAQE